LKRYGLVPIGVGRDRIRAEVGRPRVARVVRGESDIFGYGVRSRIFEEPARHVAHESKLVLALGVEGKLDALEAEPQVGVVDLTFGRVRLQASAGIRGRGERIREVAGHVGASSGDRARSFVGAAFDGAAHPSIREPEIVKRNLFAAQSVR